MRSRLLVAWSLVVIFQSVAAACAALGPGEAEKQDLMISGEQSVIIWDEAHHLEHFVRQADIDTDSAKVGFLVPTPQVPQLAEADPQIFSSAAAISYANWKPSYVYHEALPFAARALWGPLNLPFVSLMTGLSSRGDDPVLSQTNVGDYRATILRSDDSEALKEWLDKNDFHLSGAAQAWLEPYAQKKWTITAFQLFRKPKFAPDFKTRTVCMSFETEYPFFPYSEPTKPRPKTSYPRRELSVAILSDHRMEGRLAEGLPWPAELRYAGPLDEGGTHSTAKQWSQAAGLPADSQLPAFLTCYRDHSNPRPGKTDLVFSPGQDQSFFRRTEIDYGDRRERLDLSKPFSTLLGLSLLSFMTIVPIYGGLRTFPWYGHSSTPKAFLMSEWVDRICGLGLMAMGVLESFIYFASPIVIAWITQRRPYPLPEATIHMPFYGILFLGFIFCGWRLMHRLPPSTSIDVWMRCLYSVDAVAVGIIATLFMGASIQMINW